MLEEQKSNQDSQQEKPSDSVFLTQIQKKTADASKTKESIFRHLTAVGQTPSAANINNQTKISSVSFMAILGGVAGLFLMFLILMVMVLAFGDTNNALIVAFKIDPSQLKGILQTIVNASFGMVAFALLLAFVIGLFRLSQTLKEERAKRQRILKQIFLSAGLVIFILILWYGVFMLVQRLKIDVPLSELNIKTTPAETTDLVAPVEIEFDANEIVNSLFKRGLKPQNIGWDFNGDGSADLVGEETILRHRFEQEGNFKVNIIFNLEDGKTQQFEKMIQIARAEFAAIPQSGFAPLEVNFDATKLERSDAPASLFEWDFDGDGMYDQKGKIAIAKNIFTKIGVYNVGLRITDLHNNARVYSKKIEVLQDTAKKAEARILISPAKIGMAPFKIVLNGEESHSTESGIKKYEWDLGDGAMPQYGKIISYQYTKPGQYRIALKVTDEKGNQDTALEEIEVKKATSAPTAVITTVPAAEGGENLLEGVAPFQVQFDASHSEDIDNNIVEYAWDFSGDGISDEYGQKITHTFEQEGDFKIKLTVTDTDKQSSSAEIVIKVRLKDLQAILVADPVSGPMPLKVNFDASTSVYKKGNIVSYEWDFGDGTKASYGDAKRTHIFEKKGKYTVNVKIFTEDNKTAETTKEIYVRGVQLQACFSASPTIGPAPLTVQFDSSCSKGEVTKWKWDFGDGFIATGYLPTHTFNQKGEYKVNLELIDADNNSSTFDSVVTVE